MLPTPQRDVISAANDGDVLRFAAKRLAEAQRVAVATLTAIDGPFSRPLGAQMAIAGDGVFVGDVSNGCLESAVAYEALAVFQGDSFGGRHKRLRYGVGSPFIDIQLPCGGGLDIVLDSQPERQVLERICRQLDRREISEWAIGDLAGDTFKRQYYPRPKLLIAGSAPEVLALASLAVTAGYSVVAKSDNPSLSSQLKALGVTVVAAQRVVVIDPFTAVVSLFHDHGQELPLLETALCSDAFYIGALGSRRSQATRRLALLQAGLSYYQLARLHAPIGLIPRVRDANTLAISALAEIAQSYQGLLRQYAAATGGVVQ